MGIEIERRFMVLGGWVPPGPGESVEQGYLSVDPERVVRVRLKGGAGYLTVKGASRDGGLSRTEVEVALDAGQARELMPLAVASVTKVRHRVDVDGATWEVDVFSGANAGLVMAEIELPSADHGHVAPDWLGVEVTHDHRFTNASLATRPWSTWPDAERAPRPA